MCCVTYNTVLKALAHKTGCNAQNKTSWRASLSQSRFLLFALCCSRYEPSQVERGPQPYLSEATLTTWVDECVDQMVCRALSEIKDG